jgi:2'-5' RNA ligase
MRLFVAVLPPLEIVAGWTKALVGWGGVKGVRLTPPENVHVTLKFLGTTPRERLSPLEEALAGVARGRRPFVVGVEGTGFFPSKGAPRLFWAGVGTGAGELAGLAGGVERACVALGFPAEERPFHPHVTLARLSGGKIPLPAPVLPRRKFTVGSVALMKSETRPGGPVYSLRRGFPLGAA